MIDTDAMPEIEFFSLKSLANEAATLMCSGERLILIAEDAEAWYEQLGRLCYDSLLTYRWTTTRGMFRDPRNIFGVKGEPHQTQRVSFFIRYACHREAMKAQQQAEQQGLLPSLTRLID